MLSIARHLIRTVRKDPALLIVWIALTAVAVAPIWTQRLIPQVDAANHLALVRGWHSYSNPAYRIAEYYDLRLRPVPYIGFYWTLHMLMYAVSIETAYKLFLSIYVVTLPLAVLSLTRAAGRSPWLAVMSFPLIFSQCWAYGFASYLFGLNLFIFSLALVIRFFDDARRRHLYLLLFLSFATYFFHILPWFCLGLAFLTLAIVERRHWRRAIALAATLAPSLILAIASTLSERAEQVYFRDTDQRGFVAYWLDFPGSLKEFPGRMAEIFPGHLDQLGAYSVLLVGIGLIAWQWARGYPTDRTSRRFHALFVVFFFAYLALPVEVKIPIYWFYISQRLPTIIAIMLFMKPSIEMDGLRRLLLVPVLACAIFVPAKMVSLYRSFNRRHVAFTQLIQQVPLGSSCLVVPRGLRAGMHVDPSITGPVYDHLGSWPMALRGGYNHYLFDQGVPIRPKQRLPTPAFYGMEAFDIRQAQSYDYYLVRNPSAVMRREPSLAVVDEQGEWVLFRKVADLTDEP